MHTDNRRGLAIWRATKICSTFCSLIGFSSSWVCHEKQDSKVLFRNCINDGSSPAVHALQRECTNRLKVLCSKGKVLSV